MADVTAEEAAHAHARAAVAGDLTKLMTDLTPEALAKAMAQASGGLQGVNDYELKLHAQEGDEYVFDITYKASAASMTLRDRFREVNGQWRVVDLERVDR